MPITDEARQLECNTLINYSNIIVDNRSFPFIIELAPQSILNPLPGQNQKFCYLITGIGEDIPSFVDISHSVFGICDEILSSEIINIQVFIDDVQQPVDFSNDGNVQLKTPQNPDPPTGCTGLKFNFPVIKDPDLPGSRMLLCFELTTPYPVGDNTVCLFGGGLTVNELSICGPVCKTSENCEVFGYQRANICVPVTVRPIVSTQQPITKCCEMPVVFTGLCQNGILNGTCTFSITQEICVEVPVDFGAQTQVGTPFNSCVSAANTSL